MPNSFDFMPISIIAELIFMHLFYKYILNANFVPIQV